MQIGDAQVSRLAWSDATCGRVEAGDGSTVQKADAVFFAPPVVTSISPKVGPPEGGLLATIRGSGFGAIDLAPTVIIGDRDCLVTRQHLPCAENLVPSLHGEYRE